MQPIVSVELGGKKRYEHSSVKNNTKFIAVSAPLAKKAVFFLI
jgi:hypothetical protein